MTKEQLKELATDATNEKELTCKDIPAIDLYVDQIINLISSRLAEGIEARKNGEWVDPKLAKAQAAADAGEATEA